MEREWTRSETRNGIPYYINHEDEQTQWDHPELVAAMEALYSLDTIHYGAYRTAAKLRKLQKTLHMDVVNLRTMRMAFELHGFSHRTDSVMDAFQLHGIVHEMFSLTKRRGRSTLHVGRCSDLLLNWLLSVYDTQRTGCIRILPIKISIATICAGRLTEKYRYFRDVLADEAGRITRKMMTDFMHDITQILSMLGENTTFGKSVQPSVEDCFQSSFGTAVLQDEFLQWLLSEPQTLVWLPTFHRFSTAETMKHEAKCNVCKMHPIIGLRYQCLKCFNFDLCQHCFFTRQSSRQHSHAHPMQEYCLSSKSKEDVKAFTKTVRNNLSKKRGRRVKRKYRPIDDVWEWDKENQPGYDPHPELETHVRLSQMAERLQAVERNQPPDLDISHGKDSSSSRPSMKSNRPSVATATTDDSRYQERRELEDLIDELERENDELIDDLEQMILPSEESNVRAKPTSMRNRHDDDMALIEHRNEVLARYEIVEEHNRRLEEQLRLLRRLSDGNQRSSEKHLSSDPVYQVPRQNPAHHSSNLQLPDDSNQSSAAYQTSSPYRRTAERLPPYGQSHPALDTLAHPSSGSSADSFRMPRFVSTGDDFIDGYNRQLSSATPLGVQMTNGSFPRTGQSERMYNGSMINVRGQVGVPRMLPVPPMGQGVSAAIVNRSGTHQTSSAHGHQAQRDGSGLGSLLYSSSNRSNVTHMPHMSPAGQFPISGLHENGSQILQSNIPQFHAIAGQSGLNQLHHAQAAGIDRLQHVGGSSVDQLHHTRGSSLDRSYPAMGSTIDQLQHARRPQFDKSRALESILDLNHFLPHLGNETTVHFPTMADSQAYPPEAEELDQLIQRVTEAIPVASRTLPQEGPVDEPAITMEELLEPQPRHRRRRTGGETGDLFTAANRIGQAMTSLVTRISIAGE